MAKRTNIPAIDLLRVFFILCILAAHLREYLKTDIFSDIYFAQGFSPFLGKFGVTGFVFLSGLSLGMGYIGKDVSIRPFLYRRFIRLWPLYLLVVALHLFPVSYISVPNALAHFFMVNVFFSEFSRNPGSIWFVAMIFQLYIVFPFLCRLVSENKWSMVICLALLAYAAALLGNHRGFYTLDTGLNYIPEFVFGIWLAARIREGKGFSAAVLTGVVCLGIISGLTLPWVEDNSYVFEAVSKISILASSFFLFMLLSRKNMANGSAWLKAASSATLGVFLFHRLIWKTMLSIADVNSFGERIFFLVIIGIPVIFTISWAVQKLYDYILQWPANLSFSKSMRSEN